MCKNDNILLIYKGLRDGVEMRCENMIFKRKIYQRMLEWKESLSGETALLVKGARRIGKSTIVKEFAKNEYDSYVLIDFSDTSVQINSLFEDIYDLDYFFQSLELITGVKLYKRKSVIIFDEVQLNPLARQSIKHLVRDGRYDYIETGSLLSIKKNVKDILIPSEEEEIEMYPLDYEEFLWAMGDEISADFIRNTLLKKKAFGDSVHRKLLRDFRLYMIVGGMPQAIDKYISTKNFTQVDKVKRRIIKLYEDDFRKIDRSGKSSMFFYNIPAQLNSGASRYMVSSVDKNSRASRISELLQDMLDSMTINIAYHSNDPSVGMALTKNLNTYKLFLSDTGLFVTLAFMDKKFTDNILYKKLLSDKLSANLGYVYENVVAQILKTSGNELYYHTMHVDNKKYEVDFLLSKGGKMVPVEVKSSGYNRHKSIDVFSTKYASRISDRYLIYTKDYKKDKDITMFPVYTLPFLFE